MEEREDTEASLLKSPPSLLLKTDANAVTAMAVGADWLALGFVSGNIVVLRPDSALVITDFKASYSAISSIDLDSTCVAAACLDGTVILKSLSEVYSQPLKCSFHDSKIRVSLLPDHSVASGGESGKVVITKQGWLSSLRSREIFAGGLGAVEALRANPQRDDLVAWVDELGLCVYCEGVVKRLALPQLDDSAFHLAWCDLDFIAVATNNKVGIVDYRMLRLLYTFDSNGPICGIVPFGGRDGRMVIAYSDVLHLVDCKPGALLAQVELPAAASLVSFDARWMCSGGLKRSVHLETGLPLVFCVCENGDLVTVRPRSMEDSLQHSLQTGDFARAFQIAKGAGVLLAPGSLSITRDDVAELWLTHVVADGHFAEAARLLPQVLDPSDYRSWSRWVAVLLEKRALQDIVSEMPMTGLPPVVYETAILQLLQTEEFEMVVTLLKTWPFSSYDSLRVIEGLRATNSKHPAVHRALAICLLHVGQSAQAFAAFCQAGAVEALEMCERDATLWDQVLEKGLLNKLVSLDENRAVSSLFDSCLSLDDDVLVARVKKIVAALVDVKLVSAALRLLRKVSSSKRSEYVRASPFEALCDLEIDLCAQIEPNRLIELLRDSKAYSPEKALAVCQRTPGRLRETVYVLGRMGGPINSRQALTILVEQLHDLPSALQFAAREGDWETLIELCVVDPDRLGDLLEMGPGFVVFVLRKRPRCATEVSKGQDLLCILKYTKI